MARIRTNCRCEAEVIDSNGNSTENREEKVDKASENARRRARDLKKEQDDDYNRRKARGENPERKFGCGECAGHTRKNLNEAGYNIGVPSKSYEGGKHYAKDYGEPLEEGGLAPVASFDRNKYDPKELVNGQYVSHYKPQKGDVVVIQPNSKQEKPWGHMALYDGENWISDFEQRDMWGGPAMRKEKPNYVIYRPKW